MKYIKYSNTKIGKIAILEEDKQIIAIQINKEIQDNVVPKDTPLLKEAQKQLEEYFTGKRRTFDLPLNPKGTKFMKEVWKVLHMEKLKLMEKLRKK